MSRIGNLLNVPTSAQLARCTVCAKEELLCLRLLRPMLAML